MDGPRSCLGSAHGKLGADPAVGAVTWVAFYALFLFQAARRHGFLLLIDGAFVPIHEGGHVIFHICGDFMGIAGGTLMQLLAPFLLAAYFFFRRQPQGVAFCMFFLFEQFLPIATYMADARAQDLPLLSLGSGEDVIHDWNYLFGHLGVLAHDIQIAALTRFAGWLGMIGVVVWLIWRGLNDVGKDSATDSEHGEKEGEKAAQEYPEQAVTEKILQCAFAVHNALGAGFLEKVYSNALAIELRLQGLACSQEVGVKVRYKNTVVGDYVADLFVGGRVLVELKVCASFDPAHFAQTMNYVRACGIRVGLLLNFGRPKLEYRRLVC